MNHVRKSSIQKSFLFFCFFVLFLTSMRLWIGWEKRDVYINAIVVLFMLVLNFTQKVKYRNTKKNVIPLLLFCIACIYAQGLGIGVVLSCLIPATFIFLLEDRDRVDCLECIVKWFAILLIPSIVIYFLVQTIGLPSFGKISYGDIGYLASKENYLVRENYLFYAATDRFGIRFNGPFLEPGQLGMICAFLLFADGYNFKKKETWIIIFTILLTFSLSGFVLGIVGYLFVRFYQGRISLKTVISFSLLVLIFCAIGFYYNGGSNYINELILSRLEPDEETGISGNNRIAPELIAAYYLPMLHDSHLLLFGYSDDIFKNLAYNGLRGTGFYMWMIRHGLIGTFLALIPYLSIVFFLHGRKYAFLFFIFVVMSFWQRSQPFWFSWIICYFYGITCQERQKKLLVIKRVKR